MTTPITDSSRLIPEVAISLTEKLVYRFFFKAFDDAFHEAYYGHIRGVIYGGENPEKEANK